MVLFNMNYIIDGNYVLLDSLRDDAKKHLGRDSSKSFVVHAQCASTQTSYVEKVYY